MPPKKGKKYVSANETVQVHQKVEQLDHNNAHSIDDDNHSDKENVQDM
jgi:hypothetical protein